jgi:HPt (histidine-containing phosphotransfer) domain-containing protein
MRNTLAATAALLASLAGAVPARAQDDRPALAPATVAQAPECDGAPLAAVAHVLRLVPDQVQAFAQLLQSRQETLGPILREIALREQRIRELLAAGGNPAEIGVLVVQVHQLRKTAESVQAQFLTAFASLLAEDQLRTWNEVRGAARLQPVLPAFVALQVL